MSKKAEPATAMITAIREGLPAGIELDEREEALLDLAARQARDVAAAEADIAGRGYLVTGSRGQDVLNPSIAEVRQSRIALGRLLGQLDLPESTKGCRQKRKGRRRGALEAAGMTRVRRDLVSGDVPDERAILDLIIGPVKGGFSEEQLKLAWEAYGAAVIEMDSGAPGTRPWCYWHFVLEEEQPRATWDSEKSRLEDKHCETLRLAELGELRDDELAAIAEKANEARVRIGTPGEHISGGGLGDPKAVLVDREAVELYEAVSEASSRSRERD